MFLVSGAAASDLTGPKCNANTIHWTYDTWMLANGTGKAMVKTGGDTWFFLTADYAFGHALERDTVAVDKAGGKVLGKVRLPLNTNDFSSFLLQAQARRPRSSALPMPAATPSTRSNRAPNSASSKAVRTSPACWCFSDVTALGLQTAQGLVMTEAWYWDMNDANRAWTKRWQQERPNKFPTMVQAGVYSAVTHYLKAVDALKSAADGKAVVAEMKKLPTDDPLFGKGTVRADGRKMHPAYLFEVKAPDKSKHPGDFYRLLTTIPANEAFRPLNEGNCPLAKG